MQFFALLSLYAVAVSAATPSAKTCNGLSSQVRLVRNTVLNPTRFCQFYRQENRITSPLAGIFVGKLKTTCDCILKSARQKPFSTKPALVSPVGAVCNTRYANSVKKNFKSPTTFCKFFNRARRSTSPIKGLAAKNVFKGCKCILDAKFSTTKNTTTTTTRTTTTTSSPTTTSTFATTTTSLALTSTTSSTTQTTTQTTSTRPTTSTQSTTVPTTSSTTSVATTLLTTTTTTPVQTTSTTTTTTPVQTTSTTTTTSAPTTSEATTSAPTTSASDSTTSSATSSATPS